MREEHAAERPYREPQPMLHDDAAGWEDRVHWREHEHVMINVQDAAAAAAEAWVELQNQLEEAEGLHGEDLIDDADIASMSGHLSESVLSGDEEFLPVDDAFDQDTSAEAHYAGEDIQGIPWADLNPTRSRAEYRAQRLASYPSYYNLPEACEQRKDELDAEALRPFMDLPYFHFYRNYSCVKSKVVHFQLRHLVWATSQWDVYVQCNSHIHHWDLLKRQKRVALDCTSAPSSWPVYTAEDNRPQVNTLCIKHGLCAAGGFNGEVWVQRLEDATTMYSDRVTYDENGITNGLEIYETRSGALRVLASNNDCVLRSWEPHMARPTNLLQLPYAINYSVINEDGGKLLAVVGDDPDAVLVDSDNGRIVHKLAGHCDYSFAVAWHPNGHMLATGNQDKTVRVWDARFPTRSLALLQGRMGAIRSLKFSSDGRCLAAAEPADFVHVYDVHKGFQHGQTVDLFGEISGISFSPDAVALFIGVADQTYGSLMQFNRANVRRFVLP